jgi:hypothetical protein
MMHSNVIPASTQCLYLKWSNSVPSHQPLLVTCEKRHKHDQSYQSFSLQNRWLQIHLTGRKINTMVRIEQSTVNHVRTYISYFNTKIAQVIINLGLRENNNNWKVNQ